MAVIEQERPTHTTRGALRETMPGVAAQIDEYRREHGVAWVNDQVRRGMAGEADRFYAIEAGHVVGTPFTGGIDDLSKWAIATSRTSMVVMMLQPGAPS